MGIYAAMCGIAGIWERSGKAVDPAALDRMSASLVHRGPDGQGVHLDGGLGLANRRLSIIDPTPAGDQPMSLAERGLWITYNGEIHNYVELRGELESLGARFRTQTDTEVVLHAYATWGSECFERFNGMWALALWDERERRLVLSRDRFAIKPLCFAVRDSRICFASEPKAIVAAFPDEREPDRAEIAHFLGGAYTDAGERTFFANVRNVPAATCIEFREDEIRRTRYWRFQPGDETPKPDADERFRELLTDSVRLRMRSDVPVGACVSGGLDSSAIAALVDVRPGRPMHCFSLRFDGWVHDESRYAAIAADSRPGDFVVHWVRPESRDVVGTMRKIVWHHDAPTPVRGRLGQWFVMAEAGRHVKVVLDGQGGDELLAGYSKYVLPYVADRLLRAGPSAPARTGLVRDLADLAWIESRSRLWFLARAPLPYARRAFGRRRRPAAHPYRSRVNNELWNELTRDGLPEVLHAEDAMSMAFSVESRTPFLDHRLVELCFSLPYTDKIADGWTKSILRRSLTGVVPAEILARRRKIGFSSPVTQWLRLEENLRDVRELLLDRTCLERGVFDRHRLERALSAFANGSQLAALHRTGPLWRWITLELWFQEFVDR
ncbi:MAG: asparagine synthase (glutamine-hydrolyzing) [Actinomycetota bacterium]|nr:asparagine synthase (glutamine-hydrolyzing) [Actinomycetota bacterium]